MKLGLMLWLRLELARRRMVLVGAVAKRLLVLVLLVLLRVKVVHGGMVGVCLMRLRCLRMNLSVGILLHRLHLGVLSRRRKEVGACLILLVAHKRHRVPRPILLVLMLLMLMLLMLMLLMLMLMLMLLRMELLLLLKLGLVLLVLRVSRLGRHLLIAMAIVGLLPMARRLLAPVVHGGMGHSSASCQ